MSRPGDVVWADGRSWTHLNVVAAKKHWWHGPSAPHSDRWTRLRHLKEFDDFRWLVRDGYRKINDYPLAHEAYRFQIANLTELLAQAESERDAAEEWRRERDTWIATCDKLREELAETAGSCACGCTLCLEASSVGHQWRVETDPVMTEESDGHVRIEWRDDRRSTLVARSMLTHLVYAHIKGIRERAAIVAWHRRNLYRPDHWTGEDYADAIESGEHLAGDDE